MGGKLVHPGNPQAQAKWPRHILALSGLAFAAIFLGGMACGGGSNVGSGPGVTYPDFVQTAPAQVQEAYTFAVEHPEVLRYIPCYCGCGAQGHTSNEECFVAERRADGSVVFEQHGAA